MDSELLELTVIGVAMLFFLLLSATGGLGVRAAIPQRAQQG
jgi:hypothetical protein